MIVLSCFLIYVFFSLKMLTEILQARNAHYSAFQNAVILRTKFFFVSLLGARNYSGKLNIDQKKKSLTFSVSFSLFLLYYILINIVINARVVSLCFTVKIIISLKIPSNLSTHVVQYNDLEDLLQTLQWMKNLPENLMKIFHGY